MKRKRWLIICAVALVAAVIIAGAVWYQGTAWERDFTVKYIDYISDGFSDEGSHRLYEITNSTNRTMQNVYATIHVDNGNGMNAYKSFDFENFVDLVIAPGETIEYRLYWQDVEDAAKEHNTKLMVAVADIVGMKHE